MKLLLLILLFPLVSPAQLNIVADGNSYVVGYPSYTSFPTLIGTSLGLTVVNFGVSGQTTPQMITDEGSQVLPTYDATKTNILLVCEGGNDIYFNGSATNAVANMKTYCNAARAAGFKVILTTVIHRNESTPFGDDATTYNSKLDAFNAGVLADKSFYDYIIRPDTAAIFQTYSNGGYHIDEVHPNQAGQQKFADLFVVGINAMTPAITPNPIIFRGRKKIL
jgi:lysophospholipase L1-like esterase